MEEELQRKTLLPRNENELISRLNTRYTIVPNENRKQFLDTNNNNKYFRVYRNQRQDDPERMPFSLDIGEYKGLNEWIMRNMEPPRNIYTFESERGEMYIDDNDEIYMIGTLDNQRGGKKRKSSRKVKRRTSRRVKRRNTKRRYRK